MIVTGNVGTITAKARVAPHNVLPGGIIILYHLAADIDELIFGHPRADGNDGSTGNGNSQTT